MISVMFNGVVEKVSARKVPSKTGKEYDVVELLVAVTDGKYTDRVPVEFFGKDAATAQGVREGDEVEVNGKLKSREWNGRHYVSVGGIGVTVAAPASGYADTDADAVEGDMPF